MRTRALLLWTAAALGLGGAGALLAQWSFQDLDMDELRQSATEYRRRANLLRRSVGIRQRKISEAESRAGQIVQGAEAQAEQRRQAAANAQRQAQANQATANFGAQLFGQLIGNDFLSSAIQAGVKSGAASGVANANAGAANAAAQGEEDVQQAHKTAAPLRDQARLLEGDKKKLALKADQYEQLADAKDLLIAAETLRTQAEEAVKSAGEGDKIISSSRSFVENLDIW